MTETGSMPATFMTAMIAGWVRAGSVNVVWGFACVFISRCPGAVDFHDGQGGEI